MYFCSLVNTYEHAVYFIYLFVIFPLGHVFNQQNGVGMVKRLRTSGTAVGFPASYFGRPGFESRFAERLSPQAIRYFPTYPNTHSRGIF